MVSMLVVSGAKVVVMHVRRKIGTRKGSQNADFPLGDGEKNMVKRRPALFNRFCIDICLGRREGVAERVSPSECTGITMCVSPSGFRNLFKLVASARWGSGKQRMPQLSCSFWGKSPPETYPSDSTVCQGRLALIPHVLLAWRTRVQVGWPLSFLCMSVLTPLFLTAPHTGPT